VNTAGVPRQEALVSGKVLPGRLGSADWTKPRQIERTRVDKLCVPDRASLPNKISADFRCIKTRQDRFNKFFFLTEYPFSIESRRILCGTSVFPPKPVISAKIG